MTILKTGQLIKHSDERKEKDEYVMRLISTEDLTDVVALEKYVYDLLPNKQVFYGFL